MSPLTAPKPLCNGVAEWLFRDSVLDIGRPFHRPCLETITGHF